MTKDHAQPGDVLIAMHAELETRTKSGLARAATKAAEQAAGQDGETNLNCSGKLRDLASAAARVSGWDSEKPSVTLNQLVVTQEKSVSQKNFVAQVAQNEQRDQGTKCGKLRKRGEWQSEREFGQAGRLDYVNFGTYVPRI